MKSVLLVLLALSCYAQAPNATSARTMRSRKLQQSEIAALTVPADCPTQQTFVIDLNVQGFKWTGYREGLYPALKNQVNSDGAITCATAQSFSTQILNWLRSQVSLTALP